MSARSTEALEQVAEGIRRYFSQVREPLLTGDGLAHFHAKWTEAVKDGSIEEESRRERCRSDDYVGAGQGVVRDHHSHGSAGGQPGRRDQVDLYRADVGEERR